MAVTPVTQSDALKGGISTLQTSAITTQIATETANRQEQIRRQQTAYKEELQRIENIKQQQAASAKEQADWQTAYESIKTGRDWVFRSDPSVWSKVQQLYREGVQSFGKDAEMRAKQYDLYSGNLQESLKNVQAFEKKIEDTRKKIEEQRGGVPLIYNVQELQRQGYTTGDVISLAKQKAIQPPTTEPTITVRGKDGQIRTIEGGTYVTTLPDYGTVSSTSLPDMRGTPVIAPSDGRTGYVQSPARGFFGEFVTPQTELFSWLGDVRSRVTEGRGSPPPDDMIVMPDRRETIMAPAPNIYTSPVAWNFFNKPSDIPVKEERNIIVKYKREKPSEGSGVTMFTPSQLKEKEALSLAYGTSFVDRLYEGGSDVLSKLFGPANTSLITRKSNLPEFQQNLIQTTSGTTRDQRYRNLVYEESLKERIKLETQLEEQRKDFVNELNEVRDIFQEKIPEEVSTAEEARRIREQAQKNLDSAYEALKRKYEKKRDVAIDKSQKILEESLKKGYENIYKAPEIVQAKDKANLFLSKGIKKVTPDIKLEDAEDERLAFTRRIVESDLPARPFLANVGKVKVAGRQFVGGAFQDLREKPIDLGIKAGLTATVVVAPRLLTFFGPGGVAAGAAIQTATAAAGKVLLPIYVGSRLGSVASQPDIYSASRRLGEIAGGEIAPVVIGGYIGSRLSAPLQNRIQEYRIRQAAEKSGIKTTTFKDLNTKDKNQFLRKNKNELGVEGTTKRVTAKKVYETKFTDKKGNTTRFVIREYSTARGGPGDLLGRRELEGYFVDSKYKIIPNSYRFRGYALEKMMTDATQIYSRGYINPVSGRGNVLKIETAENIKNVFKDDQSIRLVNPSDKPLTIQIKDGFGNIIKIKLPANKITYFDASTGGSRFEVLSKADAGKLNFKDSIFSPNYRIPAASGEEFQLETFNSILKNIKPEKYFSVRIFTPENIVLSPSYLSTQGVTTGTIRGPYKDSSPADYFIGKKEGGFGLSQDQSKMRLFDWKGTRSKIFKNFGLSGGGTGTAGAPGPSSIFSVDSGAGTKDIFITGGGGSYDFIPFQPQSDRIITGIQFFPPKTGGADWIGSSLSQAAVAPTRQFVAQSLFQNIASTTFAAQEVSLLPTSSGVSATLGSLTFFGEQNRVTTSPSLTTFQPSFQPQKAIVGPKVTFFQTPKLQVEETKVGGGGSLAPPLQIQIPEVIQKEETQQRQPQIEFPQINIPQRQIQIQKQVQITEPGFKQPTINPPKISPPIPIIIDLPKFQGPTKDDGTKKKKSQRGYEVLIKKRGKYVPVRMKYSITRKEAEELAYKELLASPAASAKIRLSTKPFKDIDIKIDPFIKTFFRPGKTKRGADIVQKQRFRILSREEKTGITFKGVEAIKRKGKTKKVFQEFLPKKTKKTTKKKSKRKNKK